MLGYLETLKYHNGGKKMAKIYAVNTNFKGISASVNFENGVGVTNDPYLISWFIEQGYMVEEIQKEKVNLYDLNYNELKNIAKGYGVNVIGMKKEELVQLLKDKEAE